MKQCDKKHVSIELFPKEGEDISTMIQSSTATFSGIRSAALVSIERRQNVTGG